MWGGGEGKREGRGREGGGKIKVREMEGRRGWNGKGKRVVMFFFFKQKTAYEISL